jgi:hypothetical protein
MNRSEKTNLETDLGLRVKMIDWQSSQGSYWMMEAF